MRTDMNQPDTSFTPADAARRRWLMRSGATLAGALGAGTLGNLMIGTRPAFAADYKEIGRAHV